MLLLPGALDRFNADTSQGLRLQKNVLLDGVRQSYSKIPAGGDTISENQI